MIQRKAPKVRTLMGIKIRLRIGFTNKLNIDKEKEAQKRTTKLFSKLAAPVNFEIKRREKKLIKTDLKKDFINLK